MFGYLSEIIHSLFSAFRSIWDILPYLITIFAGLAIFIVPQLYFKRKKMGGPMLAKLQKFWVDNHFRWVILVLIFFVVIFIAQYQIYNSQKLKIVELESNLTLKQATERQSQLLSDLNKLRQDITEFVSNRKSGEPVFSGFLGQSSYENYNQQRQLYEQNTQSQFLSKFRQRLVDIGYSLYVQRIINDDELKRFNWNTQTSYIVIDWVLSDLDLYYARLFYK